jgi:hypothetical protein
MLDAQTLSQLSRLFVGDRGDALALCRLIARAALDNLRTEVAANAKRRDPERRARHDVAKWALGDEAGDPRAVSRLADELLHLLRGTLYTDAEREADDEANARHLDDDDDRRERIADLIAKFRAGEIAEGRIVELLAEGERPAPLVPAFASLDEAGERALLDERFEHYLARHVGDEGMLARLLGGVVEAVVERPAQPAEWTFAAVDSAGEPHLLAPTAAQVTADGELVLDAVPAPAPLTVRHVDEAPSLVLPGLELDELDDAFVAFGPAALPVHSIRGDRLIGLATALWAAEVRDTLRAAATSVSTVVQRCIVEQALRAMSLRADANGARYITPAKARADHKAIAYVEPRQQWDDSDERLGLGGAVARSKRLEASSIVGGVLDPAQAKEISNLVAGYSKIAAGETGKALLYYLTDRAQRNFWAETPDVQRRLRHGDLLARISIPGGFAGLADLIGDHRRGADYEEFFSALEIFRFADKRIGQLLSYRLTGPTGEGEPGAKVTKSVLHIRLHEPLLPFHVAYIGGGRRAPLVPVTLDVPLPVKKPLSRQLHRAASDLADAILCALANRYEEARQMGGVEFTEQEFVALAATGHTSRKLSRDSLRRCVEALVEGGVTGKNKPAEPLLAVTGPNRYRAAREIMHRDFTKAAEARDTGRRVSARKFRTEPLIGE